MFRKLKQLFMPSHNEYFNKYVLYFPTIGKQLKMGRHGIIQVIDKTSKATEIYEDWDELNRVYELFPVDQTQPIVESNKPVAAPMVKYWAQGHNKRSAELIDFFSKTYNCPINRLKNNFNKPDWVYYFDSAGCLCSTNNVMVRELLAYSSDWVEYKLPEPKKFTKADIAGMIGMDADSFIIVD